MRGSNDCGLRIEDCGLYFPYLEFVDFIYIRIRIPKS
jgi:hypothetical protein